MPLKFTVNMPGLTRFPPTVQPWEAGIGPAEMRRMARRIDELGFDAINVPEHIVIPTAMVPIMGAFWPHALTAMAFIAGATERVRINSGVVVLPYHEPVNLAKQVATLDLLSGGRVMLSIGSGHAEGEFAALGIPFAERGRRTDEALAVLKACWTEDAPSFHGQWSTFSDIAFEPRPVQRPHPPIWVGGNSRNALRRAARHGDGWCPWLVKNEELPGQLAWLRDQPEFAHRGTRPFDVWVPAASPAVDEHHRPTDEAGTGRARLPRGRQALIDALGALALAGVTWTSAPLRNCATLEEWLEQLEWLATEVCAPLRG